MGYCLEGGSLRGVRFKLLFMDKIIYLVYRAGRRIRLWVFDQFNHFATVLLFNGHKVDHRDFKTNGSPFVMVANGGQFHIGKDFSMNNGIVGNPIGCHDRCTFFVDKGAVLSIGDHVGMSQSALICHESITIGNYVKIGGGVKIFDTDFHSLDPILRSGNAEIDVKAKAPVVVKDHVFIGAFSIILKGVMIGANSIIGAGSVVTKSIPENQIWGGNPAKFIRNL